jgi:tripartite-type tricarboxylate transporter receptor subunit TctC
LNAPIGTPKPVIDKLYAAASSALQQADVRESLIKVQLYVVASHPEASARRLSDEANAMREVAKKAGIQPQ